MFYRIAAVTLAALFLSSNPLRAEPEEAARRFPSPAELAERIADMHRRHEQKLKVAYIELSGVVDERPPDFALFEDERRHVFPSLIRRLHEARDDEQIRALLLTLNGPQINLAQAGELRDALLQVRRAGKKTFVYADSYNTPTYTIASAADHICLLEGGEIVMPGISIEPVFARHLLDKIGVQADYIQIGEFKGAAEQFTRSDASEELRGELNKLIDALYGQIIDGISVQRNLPRDEVRQAIDEAMLDAPAAKQRGLVDHLVDMEELRELIAAELGDQINLIHDYALPEPEELDFSNPFALLSSLMREPEFSDRPVIALIHADGMIIEGNGGASLFGGAVGSDDLRRAFREALRDEQVQGVVFRIDSPGGSPLASEIIWQAARRFGKEKPMVVSIGATAASGGYYVATAADTIFADASSVVGSIGVVGGKLVVRDLLDWAGLTTESFQRGQNAGLFTMTEPFDDRQRQIVTQWMTRTYDQFVERVMSTRQDKIRDIDQVARGRVFLAGQARELGMIDQIGGLGEAIQHVADAAGLEAGEYDLRILPAPRTLIDMIMGGDEGGYVAAPGSPAADTVLRLLPHEVRAGMARQSLLMQMLQHRPVVLLSPYLVRVR